MHSKILFIVEGFDDEARFVEEYLSKVGFPSNFSLFRYGCNLYNFYDCLLEAQPDGDFSDIDVLGALRSMEERLPLKNDLNVLLGEYTDIYLIFDLDNHDAVHSKQERYDIIRAMSRYFNNSTDSGQLLIDSPMVEAYRDISVSEEGDVTLNDDVSLEVGSGYKKLVGERGICFGYSRFGRDTFLIISSLHLKRMCALLDCPISTDTITQFDAEAFATCLIDYVESNKIIPIIATIAFIPAMLSSYIIKEMMEIPLDTGLHMKKIPT